VKGEKAIVALIVAASSIMVAGGIASATFFTIGARGWSDVSSSYTNATAECDPFDPKIATAAGIINKAFSIRSVVLWGEAVILTLLVAAFSIATHVCRARLTFLRQAVSNQQAVLVNRASLRITRTFMAVFISIIGRFLFAVTFATSTALGPYNPECGVCEDCQSPFFKLSQWLVLTPQIQVCADFMVVYVHACCQWCFTNCVFFTRGRPLWWSSASPSPSMLRCLAYCPICSQRQSCCNESDQHITTPVTGTRLLKLLKPETLPVFQNPHRNGTNRWHLLRVN